MMSCCKVKWPATVRLGNKDGAERWAKLERVPATVRLAGHGISGFYGDAGRGEQGRRQGI